MLTSKFKFRALTIPLLIIILTIISIFILTENSPITIKQIRWIDIYMTVLFLFTWIWLVFGELRTKIIVITIRDQLIEKKNYLGQNKQYNFKDFDGYKTSLLSSKGGTFEYLYIVKNDEKIIKISEAYHKNYFHLKDKIAINLKDLGEISFSYKDEFKEIFK